MMIIGNVYIYIYTQWNFDMFGREQNKFDTTKLRDTEVIQNMYAISNKNYAYFWEKKVKFFYVREFQLLDVFSKFTYLIFGHGSTSTFFSSSVVPSAEISSDWSRMSDVLNISLSIKLFDLSKV